MKKANWFLSFLVLLFTASSLVAKRREYRGPPRICEIQSSCPDECKEEKPKPCKPCGKPRPPRQSVLYPYRGCLNQNDFFVNLEYLIWKARNEAFVYAKPISVDANGNVTDGSSERIDEDWDSGFRIGLGWNTGLDYWDITASWTYYHNHSTSTSTAATDVNGSGLVTTWLPRASNAGSARANWRLNYNVIDFEVGRGCFFGRYLVFRPFMGPRLAFLYQDFRARYTDPFNPLAQALPGRFVGENDQWGLGPRIGTDGKWFLGTRQFCIFSNISFSLLYGKTSADLETLQANSPVFGNLLTTLKYKDSFYQIMPSLQFMMGLEWGRCFWNWYYVNLRAGWEMNYWWNQMKLPWITGTFNGIPEANVYSKPLAMKGVSVRLRMDF